MRAPVRRRRGFSESLPFDPPSTRAAAVLLLLLHLSERPGVFERCFSTPPFSLPITCRFYHLPLSLVALHNHSHSLGSSHTLAREGTLHTTRLPSHPRRCPLNVLGIHQPCETWTVRHPRRAPRGHIEHRYRPPWRTACLLIPTPPPQRLADERTPCSRPLRRSRLPHC